MADQWEYQSLPLNYQLEYQPASIRDEVDFDATAEQFLLRKLTPWGSYGWEVVHIENGGTVQITTTRIEYLWEASFKRRKSQSVGEGSRMTDQWEYMSLSFAEPVTVYHRQLSGAPLPIGALHPRMNELNHLGDDGWELACAIPSLSGVVFTDFPTALATIRVTLIMKRLKQPYVAQSAQKETSQLTQWEYAFLAISKDGTVENGVQVLLNGEVVMRKDMSQEIGPIRNAFLFAYFQELGSQGWEMVTATGNRYIFKHCKQ